MKLDFEYGLGTMQAELPDNTDVFISGETVKDPACIPEDQLEAAYLESLAHPIGMPTLTELAHKGTTVTIIVPDRVKGGEQPTSHRKLSIKYILKELYAAGVEKKDILFIISNGLHPRSKASDAKAIFGDELFNEFWHSGQIISHDSEDQEHMIYLGTTKRGEIVINTPGPAIAEAVYNACGVRVTSLPITPEKVKMGMMKNELEKRK